MIPEQRVELIQAISKQRAFEYVDSLLAQARAEERERVITAMSEYLPADSRAKIAAAIRARKDA